MEPGKAVKIQISLTDQHINKIDWMDNYFIQRERAMHGESEEVRDKQNRSLIIRMAVDSLWAALVQSIVAERQVEVEQK